MKLLMWTEPSDWKTDRNRYIYEIMYPNERMLSEECIKGSVLTTITFLLYINDMPYRLSRSVNVSADAT